jgi:iron-only hydrogenase group A
MAERTVRVKIDGKEYAVAEGSTILDAAEQAHVRIPTLCYLKGVSEEAACSICVVEVKGAKTLVRSCVNRVAEAMEILTNSERVQKARRLNLELMLASHPQDCFVCGRSQSCELYTIASELGVREVRFPRSEMKQAVDISSPAIIRDPNKCILCRRCISVCEKIQSVRAIEAAGRGKQTRVTTYMDKGLGNVDCTNCGQCVLVCPTGALTENYSIEDVWSALNDAKKTVIVQAAPAVRASIGEEFGMAAGTLVTGKLASALRRLGFDRVFDTQFTADLTIVEEAHELIDRLNKGGALPLITSCSPGWVKFAEHCFPKVLDNISSCKSPQQMFGAIAKTYYAEKAAIDPRNLVVVSVMPCTAKKFEAKRPEMDSAFSYWKEKLRLRDEERFPDVDFVLTTREAAAMIRNAGIDFVALPDEGFDEPLGISTGAGTIFGSTGGVMEAALRTAYEAITGKALEKLDFEAVRGLKGIKTAEIDLAGKILKVAVASSLGNARILLEEVQEGRSPYAFIEIMTCPGGCLGGGGQPIPTTTEIRQKRMEAIYREDLNMPIRKSHDNPAVQALYKEFLGQPLSAKAHELLHTHYHAYI